MGGGVVLGGLALLALLLSGGSRRPSGSTSTLPRGRVTPGEPVRTDGAPRGRVEMGTPRTTRDLQSRRLGIGVDLWDDLNRWSAHRDSRRREPFAGIVGPVGRIEAWLDRVRMLAAEGSVETLHTEAAHMEAIGFPVASAYAATLAAGAGG